METSQEVKDIFAALNKFQSEVSPTKKHAENPYFKSSYADLASIWENIQKPLTSSGLCITQAIGVYNDKISVFTMLGHISGQWIKSVYPVNPPKADPQGVGSAITYARRYALSAMLGLVSEKDDDGERARIAHEREDKSGSDRGTYNQRAERTIGMRSESKAPGGEVGLDTSRYKAGSWIIPEQLKGYRFPAGSFVGQELVSLDPRLIKSYLEKLDAYVKNGSELPDGFSESIPKMKDYIQANGLTTKEG